MQAIGYLRVSTGRQADSGAGLDAQRRSILTEAKRRGWAAADIRFITEQASGKDATRPGLEMAREALASGDAGALVVSEMDRLSRSLLDFASIMAEAQKQKWLLVALDCPVELGTPMGNAMATIIATLSGREKSSVNVHAMRLPRSEQPVFGLGVRGYCRMRFGNGSWPNASRV